MVIKTHENITKLKMTFIPAFIETESGSIITELCKVYPKPTKPGYITWNNLILHQEV